MTDTPDPTRARRWLVTGGTGAIGPAIVDAIAAQGDWVRVLSRDDAKAVGRPTDEVVIGDVRDPAAVAEAVRGVDVVVHAAGRVPHGRATGHERGQMHAVNVQGAETVGEAAALEGVGRVLFISTVAVYGRGIDTRRTESSPPAPESDYGISKLAAEHALTDRLGDRLCVLRPCAVYGSRLTSTYATLVAAVRSRVPIPLLDGAGHCLVTDRDLARFVLLAAMHPETGGHRFNVTDGRVYSMADLVAAMRQADRRAGPTPLLPRPLGLAARRVLGASGGAPDSRRRRLHHMVSSLVQGANVDSTAIRNAVGAVDCDDLVTGWSRALRSVEAPG